MIDYNEFVAATMHISKLEKEELLQVGGCMCAWACLCMRAWVGGWACGCMCAWACVCVCVCVAVCVRACGWVCLCVWVGG